MSTYTPIASTKITSGGVSTVTFANIPQTYTDLVVIVRPAQGTQGECDMWIRVGGGSIDTGSNYSGTYLDADGANATTRRETSQTRWRAEYNGYPDTSVGNTTNIIQFINYSNKTTYKNALIRSNSPATGLDAIVQLWRSTSAIDTISFNQSTNTFVDSNFLVGTTFDIYGIDAQGSAQAKATGGHTIIRDANYWYHIFNSSGTFTPTQAITTDYLVVAGGGGGNLASHSGGGGGAGGMRCTVDATGGGGPLESALSLTAGTAYTVTVGAGGAVGGNGYNSAFSTITSTGGGAGGGTASDGSSGGSGGGGGTQGDGVTYYGGARTSSPVQGNNGGTGRHINGVSQGAGGGGGAGAVGGNSAGSNGGAGGNGVASSISGSSVTYAGGGGGGADSTGGSGGSGGGGTGGTGSNATAGAVNTGGGGGGARYTSSYAAAGGSGIVIIRYAV